MSATDEEYLRIVLDAIRVCALYKPKFGQGAKAGGLTLEQFRNLYRGDAFYGWFGLDNPMMYAAHKAATAYTKGYLPCAVILSGQIDGDVLMRYRAEKWAVVTGITGAENPLISTYDFMRDVVGYDLAAFFQRNSPVICAEMDAVLKALLVPDAT